MAAYKQPRTNRQQCIAKIVARRKPTSSAMLSVSGDCKLSHFEATNMNVRTKQKLSDVLYILLGVPPLVYVICFISFIYYTGNRFGNEVQYNVVPERKSIYLNWIYTIQQMENYWLTSFVMWVLLLVCTVFFFRNVKKKSFILATLAVFLLAVYMLYFSGYGGHEGWLMDYWSAVQRINRR
jgi:hypothetical protein